MTLMALIQQQLWFVGLLKRTNDYRFFIDDRFSSFNIWICNFFTEDVE